MNTTKTLAPTVVKYNPATQTERSNVYIDASGRTIVTLNWKRDSLAGCTRSEGCDFGDRCLRAHPVLDFRVDHVKGQSTDQCRVRIVPA